MQQDINDASARAEASRPHRALRSIAACGAALAALAIALMAAAVFQNWEHAPLDQVPWLPLAMLASMLALLSSGVVLMRRLSDVALVVFMTSALLGLPFTLFGLAIAFSD
ncbi:MAG: hypothetical protein K2Y27_07720 [Xanthobacteraceae bacterium]|nr:hypothetical protein [Xanthobacteraceae bacterium]